MNKERVSMLCNYTKIITCLLAISSVCALTPPQSLPSLDQKDAKSKCDTCRDISNGFKEGLKKTAKSNFGGGNTNWEESRLGSYATSETRMIEIVEDLCSSGAKECHTMVEKHEELVETFWFEEFVKKNNVELFAWLCIDNIKVCCPEKTYGPTCEACPGVKDRVCKDNGECDGDGTRGGTGKCNCKDGYQGDLCDECTDGYFEESKNETHTECHGCHMSCKNTCWERGPKGCDECKSGYRQTDEDGCEDIDECELEKPPCGEGHYCINTMGKHQCATCHSACDGCTGFGAEKCKKCKEGYELVESTCTDINECDVLAGSVCDGERQTCVNSPGSYTCECDEGYMLVEDECMPKPKDLPKPTPPTKSKQTDKTKKKGKKKDKPSLIVFVGILVVFAIIGKLLNGNIPLTGALIVILSIYVYWFSTKFEPARS